LLKFSFFARERTFFVIIFFSVSTSALILFYFILFYFLSTNAKEIFYFIF
jgi:hypothetical protein